MPLSLDLLGLAPETEGKEEPINVFEIEIAEKPIKTGLLSEEDKEKIMEFRSGLFDPTLSHFTRFADEDLPNYMYLNVIGFTEKELEVFKFAENFTLDLEIVSELFDGEFTPDEELLGKLKRDLLRDYMPFIYAMKLYYPEKYTQFEQVIDKEKLKLYCHDWIGYRDVSPSLVSVHFLPDPEDLTALTFVALLYPDKANGLGITEESSPTLTDSINSYLVEDGKSKPFNYLSALFACRIICPKLYETLKPSKSELEKILEGYINGISDKDSDYQNDERLIPFFFLRVLMEDEINIKNLESLLKQGDQSPKPAKLNLPEVRRF